MSSSAPRYIANFDSASAMLRAFARFLHGKDFTCLGFSPLLKPFAVATNTLPRRAREAVYAFGGWSEAIPPRKLREVRAEEIARWAMNSYPRGRYPAVAVGSSNGALVHLCAALGIPWLPQTILIPVRQSGVHPDEPRRSMEAGRQADGCCSTPTRSCSCIICTIPIRIA